MYKEQDIPIETTISISKPPPKQKQRDTENPFRRLNPEELKKWEGNIRQARLMIADGHVNETAAIATSIIQKSTIPTRPRKPQPWFNRECYTKRKETLQALHKARTENNKENLNTYAKKLKDYKLLLKIRRAEFIEEETRKVVEEAQTDPFIALRNRKYKVNVTEIPINIWEEHFKQILNTENIKEAYGTRPMDPKQHENEYPQITSKEI